jgi:hypothetical protein
VHLSERWAIEGCRRAVGDVGQDKDRAHLCWFNTDTYHMSTWIWIWIWICICMYVCIYDTMCI